MPQNRPVAGQRLLARPLGIARGRGEGTATGAARDEAVELRAPMTPQEDARLAAIHEAGHAVIGYLLGGRVKRVRTHRDGNGSTQFDDDAALSNVSTARMLLAGRVAEVMAGRRGDFPEPWSDEQLKARALLEGAGIDDIRLERRAVAALLRENWAAAEAVARLLLEPNAYGDGGVEGATVNDAIAMALSPQG